MTTYVRRLNANTAHVIQFGATIRLADGTAVPYGNLPLYDQAELLAIAVYAFEDPTPPEGKVLVSVSYEATPSGIDQLPVFEDAPIPPVIVPSWSPISIIKALQSINKAKADLFINKMAESDRVRFSAATAIQEDSPLLLSSLSAPGVGIDLEDLRTAIDALTGNGHG